MSPAEFIAAYGPTADAVSHGTGIDPIALLAQWANETDWGSVVVGSNLGNIRCSPTSFCSYATLEDFAWAAIAVWHQTAFINNTYPNGFEPFRAAAASAADIAAALAAIVASPWSSGHYGGSLDAFASPLEEFELTPQQAQQLANVEQYTFRIFNLLLHNEDVDNYPGGSGSKLPLAFQPQLDRMETEIKAIPGGGGTEPIEPAEPKTITLKIDTVPGTATGTIS